MAFLDFLNDPRRRRLAEGALTPPINPNAPVSLPDVPKGPIPMPPPMPNTPGPTPAMMPGRTYPNSLPEIASPMPPALARNVPGGAPGSMPGPRLEASLIEPPTQGQRYQVEKESYMRGTPGRGRSALSGAGFGLLQGLSNGNGLLGAASGALTGAISPQALREQQFNQLERPKILERFQYEDADRAAQRQGQQDATDAQYKTAQIGAINRSNIPPPMRPLPPPRPINTARGALDPTTNRIIPGTEPLPKELPPPKAPTAVELDVDPDTGRSWQEQSDFAYNDRGGDQYVYDRLPERTRRILEDENDTYSSAEVAMASREFQAAITRQHQSDDKYSRGAIRAKHAGQGRRPATQKPTSPRSGSAKPMKGQPGRRAISVQEAADLLK